MMSAHRFKHLKHKTKNTSAVSLFNKAFLVASTLLLLSCSSNDVGIRYYSLNAIQSQAEKITTVKHDQTKTFVVINNIALADFLDTGGLVMQIDSHQIQISSRHQWGDKLSKAIENYLITQLSTSTHPLYVEAKTSKNDSLADKKLTLSFEQFTVTNQNETVISGFYTIESNANNNKQREKTFFDIRQTLTKDGYNHAVETFKYSLNTLAKQIESKLVS